MKTYTNYLVSSINDDTYRNRDESCELFRFGRFKNSQLHRQKNCVRDIPRIKAPNWEP